MSLFKNTILSISLLCTLAISQPSKVTSLFIASSGTEAIDTENATDRIGKMAKYLSSSLHFPFEEQTIYTSADPKLNMKFMKTFDEYDSSAFIFGAVFSGWEDNSANPGTKTSVSAESNPLTFDYFLNGLLFFPAKRFVFFICSPAFAPIDTSVFNSYQRIFAPGRLVINVTGPADDDYSDWVYSLTSIIDDMDELEATADGNLDKNISFSEWLTVLQIKANEEKLKLQPFLISKGDDFNLYQLEE